MRVVLEGHGGEAYCVIISDSLVKEEALDAELQTVEGYLGLRGRHHIQ